LHVAGVIGYAPHPRRSVAHNALTDAIYQAEQVCEIWQRLTSPHSNRCEGRHASASLRHLQRTAAGLHQGACRPEMLRPRSAYFSRVKPHAYLVIRIGRRWRLLSKNGGQQWRLMTHETYNQEYRK
jgi:hypothetical protein